MIRAVRSSWPFFLIASGLALSCLPVLVAAAWRLEHRTSALVAAHDLTVGQALTTGDLDVVRIVADPKQQILAEARESVVVGRSVRLPVIAGTLISEELLGPGEWPPPGQALAAVSISPGQAPSELDVANQVLVVTSLQPAEPVPATVVTIHTLGPSQAGTRVVSLLMTPPDAIRMAQTTSPVTLIIAAGQQ